MPFNPLEKEAFNNYQTPNQKIGSVICFSLLLILIIAIISILAYISNLDREEENSIEGSL